MDIFGIDSDQIDSAIASARNGGGLIKDAVGLAKTIRDLVRPAAKPVDHGGIASLIGDLSQKLADAQIAQLELVDLLVRAEGALKAAKADHDEALRYELAELPMGGLVLALKPGDPKGEPHHYLCQPCAAEGKRYVLQPAGQTNANLVCPRCAQVLRLRATQGTGLLY